METEQAHSLGTYSLGRDAALRCPRASWCSTITISDPRTPQRGVPTRNGFPFLWLNLVCLDAPVVSVTWLWLFARTFHATIDPVNCVALFLTAWLIYLADRFADSRSLPDDVPRSLRHEFCLRHRGSWVGALLVIAVADAITTWYGVGAETAIAGAVVGALALIHLFLNHSLAGAWPPLPLKEFTVGALFASGTLVALFPVLQPITQASAASAVAFGGVCTLNCVSIAYWEKDLDERQGKASFATRFPGLDPHFGKLLFAFALGSGVTAIIFREAAPIIASTSVSAFLLASVDSLREKIARDHRTALADLVLLTPLLALLVMKA